MSIATQHSNYTAHNAFSGGTYSGAGATGTADNALFFYNSAILSTILVLLYSHNGGDDDDDDGTDDVDYNDSMVSDDGQTSLLLRYTIKLSFISFIGELTYRVELSCSTQGHGKSSALFSLLLISCNLTSPSTIFFLC